MKINEIMTRNIQTIGPDQSIRKAAEMMENLDSGALLVNDGDRLVGMVTDRDLCIRALAKGMDAETPVRQVMTPNIRYCFEDQELQQVATNMADIHLRRLPVMSRDKRLVGMVSLGNIASSNDPNITNTVLRGVAQAH